MTLAYWTGAFARASKVPPLSTYLRQLRKPEATSSAAQAIAYFHRLKARGVEVSITRTQRED